MKRSVRIFDHEDQVPPSHRRPLTARTFWALILGGVSLAWNAAALVDPARVGGNFLVCLPLSFVAFALAFRGLRGRERGNLPTIAVATATAAVLCGLIASFVLFWQFGRP